MRADRLLGILLLLQNHKRLTSRDLAAKLEVSERTIFRDMEALSAAGIPVYAERGSQGGWALSEGYRTNLTGMKSEEIVSLLLSAPSTLLKDLGIRNHFEAAFEKLLAASPAAIRHDAESVRQRIHIDGAGWHQSNESFPLLSTVQEAVWEQRELLMQYRREENHLERIVKPLGLVAKRSTWYLVAQTDGDTRTYRISRIQSANMLDQPFERPADFDLAAFWEQSTRQFKQNLPRYLAQVRMSSKLRSRMDQEHYVKILRAEPERGGWLQADLEFHTLGSACEIVLSFGALIEVIAPGELRTRVMEEAAAVLSLYRQDKNE